MWLSRSNRLKNAASILQTFTSPKNDYFLLEQIKRYFNNVNKEGFQQVISDKTCNDLDLDEVFMFVDRTVSKVGQQYLYSLIRTLPKDNSRIANLNSIINAFDNNTILREEATSYLCKLKNSDSYGVVNLFQSEQVTKPSWFWLIKLLFTSSVLCLGLAIFIPWLFIPLIFLFATNSFIHFWNKGNVYQYSSSIPQLILLQQVSSKLYQYKVLAIPFIDINRSIKDVRSICRKMSIFKLEAKLQDDMTMIADSILEFIKILFLLEPVLLFRAVKKIESEKEQIHNLFSFIGQIDTALSIWLLRQSEEKHCIPQVELNNNSIDIKNVYHPLVPNCIRNSVTVTDKSILLTGSNMSGKTTFIRTIGVNVILAQTLNTCFAEHFSIPKINIHSAVRISDDLLSNKSYYFEEVSIIKQMIEECSNDTKNLFLLDEIFKGTNTNERIAAGKAVLSHLCKGNYVFLSTHDLELTDLLADTYAMYHFTEVVNEGVIKFDYMLKKGVLQSTNALKILKINGYPDNILAEAEIIAQNLKSTQPRL